MKKEFLKTNIVWMSAMLAAVGSFTACKAVPLNNNNQYWESPTDSGMVEYTDREKDPTALGDDSGNFSGDEDSSFDDSNGFKDALEKEGNICGFDYKLEGNEEYGPDADRGWFLFKGEESDECIIMICSGRKSSGGYSMEIVDIDYSEADELMTVTVDETAPDEGWVVTEALTNPTCYLRLSKLPNNVKVRNSVGSELNYQGEYGKEINAEDGYIAILSDGAGEIVKKTYVYKTDEGKYKYINVTSVTESWGSTKWKDTLDGSGVVDTKEEIVYIAKNHDSCGYAIFPNNGTLINVEPSTIDDFLNTDF